ncbi:MAG: indole-3-glycerol phosphate synthase TrpC [Chlorobiales bacterium]|jgi:indole-3-glycerol phosphate synthase|nr:indole-3-glycerol phosphate synthase TrpC [Chlorobiales bacterium]
MNYLNKILIEKKGEVEKLKAGGVMHAFKLAENSLPTTRNFSEALRRQNKSEPLRLIAELKKASPSRGLMVEDFRPLEIAERYRLLGASSFSVLTDEKFFQGHADYLKAVRQKYDLPVLRKDFMIDELQVYEARLMGADAILLIVAALDLAELKGFRELAESLGMHVLVEVHDGTELELAAKSGANIIGVNNRDLKSFSVDLGTSINLRPQFPEGAIAVSESGIKTEDDLRLLEDADFDAVLIGEGLIQTDRLSRYPWTPRKAKTV